MVGEGSTYVELKGKFTFAINNPIHFDNSNKEREEAVRNFWRHWENFMEYIRGKSFISFDYDEKKLKVIEVNKDGRAKLL